MGDVFLLEYSKSARSACALCGSTIAKDVVRVGKQNKAKFGPTMAWHHSQCFSEHHSAEFDGMSGFHSLKATDQTTLINIKAGVEKESKSSVKNIVQSAVAPKVVGDSDSIKSLSTTGGLSNFKHLQPSDSYKDIPLPKGWKGFSSLIFYEGDNLKPSDKIAGFDFDGTLVDTKVYRPGADAWSLLYPSIPAKLASFHHEGYKLVIFTNEANIDRFTKARQKAIDSKLGRLNGFMETVKVPLQILIACGRSNCNDAFRKPATGMWNFQEDHLNGGIPIDKERSFYVGDAAGRKADHSDADIAFAKALGLKFLLPEDMFLSDKDASADQSLGDDTRTAEQTLKTPHAKKRKGKGKEN